MRDAHPGLYTLGNGTVLTPTVADAVNLVSLGIPTTGATYFVDGTFTIDKSITFSGCHFYMAPNAKIVVQSQYDLTLLSDTLQAGCEYMWDGISITGATAPSLITAHASQIYDMQFGINFDATMHALDATDNVFKNNERSIYITNSPATYAGTIMRNDFNTSSSLLLSPHLGEIGDRAIEIEQCKLMIIGDKLSSGQGNSFKNLNCGIHIYNSAHIVINSDIYAVDNTFTDITGVTYTSGFNPVTSYMGAGIWGEVDAGITTVYVQGLNKVGDCSFRNCDKGIMLDRINADIRFVQMDDVVYGIATDNGATTHAIAGNELYNTFYGIYIHGTPASGLGITIDNNTIVTSNQLAYRPFPAMAPLELAYPRGIWVENGSSGSSNVFNIRINRIDVMANKGVGIDLTDMGSKANTQLNQIRLLPQGTSIPSSTSTPPCISCPAPSGYIHAGIHDEGGDATALIIGNDIRGNAVALQPITSFPHTAFQYEPSCITIVSSLSQLTCNDMDSTMYGIQERGKCFSSGTPNFLSVQGNRMYEHSVGIMLQGASGASGGFGTQIGTTTDDNNNQFLGSSWSTNTQTIGTTSYTCNTKIFFNQTVTLPPMRKIYTNVTGYSDCESFIIPVGTGRYELNTAAGTTYACDTKYSSFFKTTSGSYTADQITAMESFARGNDPEAAIGNAALWMDAKEFYEFLYNDQSLLTVSTVLDSFFTSLQASPFEQMRAANAAYLALMDSTTRSDSATYAAALSAAYAANLAITPSNDMEQAEQDINYLMLSYLQWGRDSLTTADEGVITTLAGSCYYAMGTAVRKARYLYHGAYGPDYFEDDDLCAGSGSGARITASGSMDKVKLYPNPASSSVTVEYRTDPKAITAVLELRNIFGQIVRIVTLPAGEHAQAVDLSGMSSGMYYYQLQVDGAVTSTGKLMVSK